MKSKIVLVQNSWFFLQVTYRSCELAGGTASSVLYETPSELLSASPPMGPYVSPTSSNPPDPERTSLNENSVAKARAKNDMNIRKLANPNAPPLPSLTTVLWQYRIERV